MSWFRVPYGRRRFREVFPKLPEEFDWESKDRAQICDQSDSVPAVRAETTGDSRGQKSGAEYCSYTELKWPASSRCISRGVRFLGSSVIWESAFPANRTRLRQGLGTIRT